MSRCKRLLMIKEVFWILLLVLMILLLGQHQSYGSRAKNSARFQTQHSHPIRQRPRDHYRGHVWGFFSDQSLRHNPYSAPSRKHNDLGLQNWRSP